MPPRAAITGTLSCTVAALVPFSAGNEVCQMAGPNPEASAPDNTAYHTPVASRIVLFNIKTFTVAAIRTVLRKFPVVTWVESPHLSNVRNRHTLRPRQPASKWNQIVAVPKDLETIDGTTPPKASIRSVSCNLYRRSPGQIPNRSAWTGQSQRAAMRLLLWGESHRVGNARGISPGFPPPHYQLMII